MENSTQEEKLFQSLQTNSEQFKIAVTGKIGIFIARNENNNL